jgi:hypothetical protein
MPGSRHLVIAIRLLDIPPAPCIDKAGRMTDIVSCDDAINFESLGGKDHVRGQKSEVRRSGRTAKSKERSAKGEDVKLKRQKQNSLPVYRVRSHRSKSRAPWINAKMRTSLGNTS